MGNKGRYVIKNYSAHHHIQMTPIAPILYGYTRYRNVAKCRYLKQVGFSKIEAKRGHHQYFQIVY